ncbi:MAG TPA: glycoside hydrolase family 57 protein [Terriglobia bacterium]|nr:glycoside hydrolase family 57 protein [Terriglobia bacterium]
MKNYLMLLWHMHQPFYKDLAEGVYTMPWTRLHALKDYYGMVAILREFPGVHVTFNMVPSLVTQLEEYARGEAREDNLRIAFTPVDQLTRDDREGLLGFAFQLNHENLMNRYPRFKELYRRSRSRAGGADPGRTFTNQDLRDLQVLSQIAWFDEIYLAGDPEIKRLVEKGKQYSEDDKSIVHNKEVELFKATLEECRRASQAGQVELSTSPFYHPILPLICNTNVAAESHPGVRLPRRPFVHPEDAQGQLRSAIELHERVFGSRPSGLWPSEGSVSDEVLRLAAAEGFKWTATDEGVLGRALQIGFHRQHDGTIWGGKELYRPHQFEAGDAKISMFFRDHELSDLIGFVYSHMDPQAAARDLHQRITSAARSTGDRPAVVSIILDGENAWEFFPGNGREFLKSFYGILASDPNLQAVTASEALEVTEQGSLKHIVPGSWINANFDVWIGAAEDNRAWDLLNDARDFFARNAGDPKLKPEAVSLALEELRIAEGSDWNWWYGPEHSTPNDEQFDILYRTHLSNIYRLLGGSPPDDLAAPIKRIEARDELVRPTGMIEPEIDGRVTTYFEWLGAGVYTPDTRAGSMHGAAQYFEALYFGYSREALYLRLDLSSNFLGEHDEFQIRVNVCSKLQSRLHATIKGGKTGAIEFSQGEFASEVAFTPSSGPQVAFARILEAKLDLQQLGLKAGEKAQIQVALWVHDLPAQIIPHEGWLTIELTEDFG